MNNIFNCTEPMPSSGKSELVVRSAQTQRDAPEMAPLSGHQTDSTAAVRNLPVRNRGCHY